MPRLLKARYVGFRSPLSAMLDHVDADFTVYEEVGEISTQACKLIQKAIGRLSFTLADAPRIPFEKLDEGDRRVIMKALQGLREDEHLKIEMRR